VIILGGYGYAYAGTYSYGSYANLQDRSCHKLDKECIAASRAKQVVGVVIFFLICGCLLCVIFSACFIKCFAKCIICCCPSRKRMHGMER